ncbi:hypothetical protein QR680_012211 [Steinernema hermaphroditum]|uniref:Uncharacterized protein n=1 Tax=Steinernema hermaphroditum TaxID=289476 RepID=A0AA39I3M6_9BILA|nr:hypothetical protein QR680_012211 [Steinernema hermaphroditum]
MRDASIVAEKHKPFLVNRLNVRDGLSSSDIAVLRSMKFTATDVERGHPGQTPTSLTAEGTEDVIDNIAAVERICAGKKELCLQKLNLPIEETASSLITWGIDSEVI